MPYSIMHISDLHRSPNDPISNAELISALVSDHDRYVQEEPAIRPPDAIVVSGDIVQGVRLGQPNADDELKSQYLVAEKLLDELANRFLDGDRSRVILVPGNHDVDWNAAHASMTVVEEKDYPPDLARAIFAESSDFRWDWKARKLYKITDRTKYDSRLDRYWEFFTRFYNGVPGLLRVSAGADANLFELAGGRIAIAAFNSCHGNDCYAHHGMIERSVIARAHLDFRDTGKAYDLCMAIWHHNMEGPPYKSDYMDVDIVRGMIGRGFRVGLYGHQHKVQIAPHQVYLPDQERMAVISAGSLCAGAAELPTGTYRSYNLIEIADDFVSAKIHVRTMSFSNLFSRGSLKDFSGKSFATLDWLPPRNAAGAIVNTNAVRDRATIERAESLIAEQKHHEAVIALSRLNLAGGYGRTLMLIAAEGARDWPAVRETANPPKTIDEFVKVAMACVQMRDFSAASKLVQDHSAQLQIPNAIVSEIKSRIAAGEAMSR
jgi:predicted phosphohydrolase